MKLTLVACLLLLVPLAFVEASREKPYAKLLFDAGYVIAHGHDARVIEHYQHHESSWKEVGFVFRSQDRKNYETSRYAAESMYLRKSLFNETTSFAIDSIRTEEPREYWKCFDTYIEDEALQPFIFTCGGTTRLRSLTEEERVEMQQFKKEQQESKKPIEMIFSESGLKIKSAKIDSASFDDTTVRHGYRALSFNTTINKGDDAQELYVITRPAGRTFVIESSSLESKEPCGKIGLEDLFLAHCKGTIQIRV